jgi:cytidylate kinase
VVITIDGPAGSGKSTIAKKVAQQLNYQKLDTGAMYRAVTLKALEQKVDLNDAKALAQTAAASKIDLRDERVYLDEQDVTEKIRSLEVGQTVSLVSRWPQVRQIMVEHQRRLAKQVGNIVVEGRDTGSVVFPQADLKIFLTASLEVRAKRRLKELKEKGLQVDLKTVTAEIKARDEIDSKREASPLIKPADAVLIDTSNKTIEDVVNTVLSLVSKCSMS